MRDSENKTAIVILAAGASTRLGQTKQLLNFKGKTLLRRAAETALQSHSFPVIAVLGANFETVKNEIANTDCEIIFNRNWKTGMSSSIKCGLTKLLEIAPEISSVIISLCDQPLIKSAHFDELQRKFIETEKPVIASFYNQTLGVPALFSRAIFPSLMNLTGDKGAREILKNHSAKIEKILIPEASFDIDTPQDFEKLKKVT